MRIPTIAWVVLLLVAAGLVSWFALGGAPASEDDLVESMERDAPEQAQGPMLSGQGRARAGAQDVVEGRFEIPVSVLDAQGKPLAGVRVTARRRGDAYPATDARRWSWGVRSAELEQQMRGGPGVTEPRPVAGEATTGEGGVATLVVTRRGDYDVRAEPEPPRVGTQGSWYLNDTPPQVPLTLRVLDGSPLRGRVVDGEGRGVEATLTASWQRDMLLWSSQPTGSERGSGAFLFPGVPGGDVTITVLIPGRMSLRGAKVATPYDGEVVIRIDVGAPLLAGTVKGADGRAIPGAIVAATVQRPAGSAPVPAGSGTTAGVGDVRYLASTDADGAFEIVGPFAGPLSGLGAAATGYVPHQAAPPLAAWSGLVLEPGRGARVEIVLYQGGTVEGRVTEVGTGAPLAGAEVQAHPLAVDGRMGRPPLATAVSDAQGRYRLDGVAVGRSMLLVRHPSHFLPEQAALRRNSGSDMIMWDAGEAAGPPAALTLFVEREGQRVTRDLALVAGVAVKGRVVDASGQPVEGAEVRAAGFELGPMMWQWGIQSGAGGGTLATSDRDGRFEIPGLAPRNDWVLRARKPPLVAEPAPPLAVVAGQAPPELTLRLVKGGVVAGRVIDGEGRPIAGAQLWLYAQDGDGSANVEQRSKDDGTFRFEGLAAGSFGISAQHPKGGTGGFQQGIELALGASREDIEIKLASAGAAISGVLVDEKGQPAAQKSLMVSTAQGHTQQALSDEAGAFRVEGLPEGDVTIAGGDWNQRTELAKATAPASDLRITWKESPSAVIEGLVLDAQGAPVPICRVRVGTASRGERQDMAMAMPAMVGGGGGELAVNGWFRRVVHGAGPYQVTVSGPQDGDGRALNLRGTTVPVADPKAGPVTIRLEPGLEIEGRVVDGAGRGVAGVSVSARSVTTITDDAGTFRLGGLPEGPTTVQAAPSAPFVRPNAVKATPGDRDVVIRLVSGVAIAGQIVAADGTPVRNGWVQVQWSGSAGQGHAAASPNADGRFRVEGIPPEALCTVSVQVWGEDGEQGAPRTLENVRAGTDDLRIEMGRGVTISGMAVTADGKPFSAGWVQVTREKDGKQVNQHYSEIKDDGRFELKGLDPGASVKLSIYMRDGGSTSEPITVEAPASGVRLVLPAMLPIRGQIAGAGGSGKWRVFAWTQTDPKKRARARQVDAQGRFTLEGVMDKGPWMIGASSQDDDRYALGGPFEGGAQDAHLTLRTGRSIEGTVLGTDGQPLANVNVQASGKDFSNSATTDAQGQFRVRGLPPGTYQLNAWSNDGSNGQQAGIEDGAAGVRIQMKAPEGG